MNKKMKKISAFITTFILTICLFATSYCSASSDNSATVYITNTTNMTATVSLKLGKDVKSFSLPPNSRKTVENIFSKKSDRLTVTFKNGTISGYSAPKKSFSDTITIKNGKTYTLTTVTKTKEYKGTKALNYVPDYKVSDKVTLKYAYKFTKK